MPNACQWFVIVLCVAALVPLAVLAVGGFIMEAERSRTLQKLDGEQRVATRKAMALWNGFAKLRDRKAKFSVLKCVARRQQSFLNQAKAALWRRRVFSPLTLPDLQIPDATRYLRLMVLELERQEKEDRFVRLWENRQ
jgi:hypothetical protein